MKFLHLITGLAAVAAASGANAATIFGIDENNNLVTFNSAAPGTFLSSTAITGVSDSLAAIDFRPLNNVLYALGSDKIVYTINTTTGAATAVSAALALTGTQYGFDFNPTVDRIRIVTNNNENYVFNPNNGTLTNATNVAYAAGDPNFGATNIDVTALAYQTSTFGAASSTAQLYAIDTATGVLAEQANSAGTLTTNGPLGVNLGSRTSFDILGGDAFALNGSTLYNVNLDTGALTSVGNTNRALFGIAIGAVPEPGTWAMMLLGFGAVGVAMRRSRRERHLQAA